MEGHLERIQLGAEFGPDDCLTWDESFDDPTMAFRLAYMLPPDFPTPLGVLRAVDMPTYDGQSVAQLEAEIDKSGQGELEQLIHSGELWTVKEDGSVTRGAEAP